MDYTYSYSLIGLLILILDIWIIIKVIQSNAQPIMKLLWIIIVLLLPLLGPLLYVVLGSRV